MMLGYQVMMMNKVEAVMRLFDKMEPGRDHPAASRGRRIFNRACTKFAHKHTHTLYSGRACEFVAIASNCTFSSGKEPPAKGTDSHHQD